MKKKTKDRRATKGINDLRRFCFCSKPVKQGKSHFDFLERRPKNNNILATRHVIHCICKYMELLVIIDE